MLKTDPPKTPFREGMRIQLNSVKYSVGRDYVEEPLVELLTRHKILALDIETWSVDTVSGSYSIKSVTIGNDEEVVLLDPRDPYQYELIKKAIKILKGIVLHNSTYDAPRLCVNGLMTPADSFKIIDTIIYARLADPKEDDGYKGGNKQRHDLAALCEKYLNRKHFKAANNTLRNIVGAKNTSEMYDILDFHIPAFVFGATDDVIVTYALFNVIRRAAFDRLTNHNFGVKGVNGDEAVRLVDREQLVNRVMLSRTLKGINVDTEYLDAYMDEHDQEQLEREERMLALGIRPGVGDDLTKYLDSIGALPDNYPHTPKGKLKADKDALALLDHPIAKEFVTFKEVRHIMDDYLKKCRDMAAIDGKIHPMTKILGASASGRMSVGEPPLQQFSGKARGIIAPDEGDTLTSLDWSRIEPTLLIYLAKDNEAILKYEEGETDIYMMVAKTAGITRDEAKVVLLAHAYGRGLDTLANGLGSSLETAERLRTKIDQTYPIAMKYARRTIRNQACIGKYKQPCPSTCHGTIYTVSGRILTIPSYGGRHKSYTAINYLIQGSAYDLLAESIIRIHEAGLSDAIYFAVHDEFIVSTEAAKEIERIMCEPPQRLIDMAGRVPILRSDSNYMGDRWKKV